MRRANVAVQTCVLACCGVCTFAQQTRRNTRMLCPASQHRRSRERAPHKLPHGHAVATAPQ